MTEQNNELIQTLNENVIKTPDNLYQDQSGKFKRRATYEDFSSVQVETREEKIKLYQLIEEENDALKPATEHIGTEIELKDVIFRKYDSVDELTGELEEGVLTYLFDKNGTVYVTSSKSVYFSLNKIFKIFGEPTYEEAVLIKLVRREGREFKYVDITLLG